MNILLLIITAIFATKKKPAIFNDIQIDRNNSNLDTKDPACRDLDLHIPAQKSMKGMLYFLFPCISNDVSEMETHVVDLPHAKEAWLRENFFFMSYDTPYGCQSFNNRKDDCINLSKSECTLKRSSVICQADKYRISSWQDVQRQKKAFR